VTFVPEGREVRKEAEKARGEIKKRAR